MFRHLLVKACQIFVGTADGISEAVGHTPTEPDEDKVYQLEKNISAGTDWIHEKIKTTASGEPFRMGRDEWVLLATLIASAVLLHQVTVPSGTAITAKLVSRMAA
jgi:hypothetical protein